MVKKGYKKTEVGVIPEDWEVKYLKQISPSQSVGLVINPSSYFDEKGTVPSLVGSQISENHINWEIANRITEASNESLPASRLKAGDLVTVRVGEPGITAVVPPELDGCNCASMMIVRQHPSFNSLWLCYMMNSRLGKAQINHVQYGTAQKQFNISDAIDFIYPVPPFPEQKTIAQTLSDVDALIAVLDKHIAKKRNIKTGTMQQLLTGKTRLPGLGEGKGYKKSAIGLIPEDWEVVLLSKLSHIATGQTPPTKNRNYYGYEYLFVSPADMGNAKYIINTLKKLSKLGFFICRIYPPMSILFTCIGSTIGKCGIVTSESTSNQQINAIFPSELVNNEYLYYQLVRSAHRIKSKAGEQAVPIVNKTEFGATLVLVCSIEEQKAIAQVLSDIDTEITALEKRRAKTQAIKQGMMQELLTGRTRLKIEYPDDPITKNSNG